MATKEQFDAQVRSYTGFYSKEFNEAQQAIEDSMTAEQKLFAADQRIKQLENLNDRLAQGYDQAIARERKLVNKLVVDMDEIDALRLALRLVIRRQIDGHQDS